MRNLLTVWMLVLVVLLVGGGGGLYGQVREDGQGGEAPVLVKSWVDTGDSPLRIEKRTGKGCCGGKVLTRVERTGDNSIGFTVLNTSEKTVRAYSLIVTNRKEQSVQMNLFYKGIPPYTGRDMGIGSYIFTKMDDPQFAFDWILFDDGSTWGADNSSRSKEILGYLKGWQTAASRADELFGGQGPHPAMRHINGMISWSWSMILPRKPEDTRGEKEYFLKGYEAVIQLLIGEAERMQTELPRQVADRLIKMQDFIPQP